MDSVSLATLLDMEMRGIKYVYPCEHLWQSQRQLYDSDVIVLSTEFR